MDELKKLLENAGISEIRIDPLTGRGVSDEEYDSEMGQDDQGERIIEVLGEAYDLIESLWETSGDWAADEIQPTLEKIASLMDDIDPDLAMPGKK